MKCGERARSDEKEMKRGEGASRRERLRSRERERMERATKEESSEKAK